MHEQPASNQWRFQSQALQHYLVNHLSSARKSFTDGNYFHGNPIQNFINKHEIHPALRIALDAAEQTHNKECDGSLRTLNHCLTLFNLGAKLIQAGVDVKRLCEGLESGLDSSLELLAGTSTLPTQEQLIQLLTCSQQDHGYFESISTELSQSKPDEEHFVEFNSTPCNFQINRQKGFVFRAKNLLDKSIERKLKNVLVVFCQKPLVNFVRENHSVLSNEKRAVCIILTQKNLGNEIFRFTLPPSISVLAWEEDRVSLNDFTSFVAPVNDIFLGTDSITGHLAELRTSSGFHYARLNESHLSLKAHQEKLRAKSVLDLQNPRLRNLSLTRKTFRFSAPTRSEGIKLSYELSRSLWLCSRALKQGVIIGGGVGLLRVADLLPCQKPKNPSVTAGIELYRRALEAQFETLCNRVGLDVATNLQKSSDQPDQHLGINMLSGRMENLLKAGVVDSCAVVKQSLENSVSAAKLVLKSGLIWRQK